MCCSWPYVMINCKYNNTCSIIILVEIFLPWFISMFDIYLVCCYFNEL